MANLGNVSIPTQSDSHADGLDQWYNAGQALFQTRYEAPCGT